MGVQSMVNKALVARAMLTNCDHGSNIRHRYTVRGCTPIQCAQINGNVHHTNASRIRRSSSTVQSFAWSIIWFHGVPFGDTRLVLSRLEMSQSIIQRLPWLEDQLMAFEVTNLNLQLNHFPDFHLISRGSRRVCFKRWSIYLTNTSLVRRPVDFDRGYKLNLQLNPFQSALITTILMKK